MVSARGRAGRMAFEMMRRADGAVGGGVSPRHGVTVCDIRKVSARDGAGRTAFEVMRRADGAIAGALPRPGVTVRDIGEERS